MKRLIWVLIIVFFISIFFYNRNFEDFSGNINYVFEDYENGLDIRTWDNGESISQSMEIALDEFSEFVEYYDVKILSQYYIDGIKVINGYSKYLTNTVPYKNNQMNLQFAISENVLVGYPQLYQGF